MLQLHFFVLCQVANYGLLISAVLTHNFLIKLHLYITIYFMVYFIAHCQYEVFYVYVWKMYEMKTNNLPVDVEKFSLRGK